MPGTLGSRGIGSSREPTNRIAVPSPSGALPGPVTDAGVRPVAREGVGWVVWGPAVRTWGWSPPRRAAACASGRTLVDAVKLTDVTAQPSSDAAVLRCAYT